LNLLTNVCQYGYDTKKVIANLLRIRPLEKREKQLKNSSRLLEKHSAKYERIVPFTEQILAMGIRIDQLLSFNIVINETAETYNLPISAAAFHVIKEIEDYRKIIGLKKELSRLSAQIYVMNDFLDRKNKAINALISLQN